MYAPAERKEDALRARGRGQPAETEGCKTGCLDHVDHAGYRRVDGINRERMGMSFFEPRRHPRGRSVGSTAADVVGSARHRLVLARTDELAVLIEQVAAYPTGFTFEISMSLREEPESAMDLSEVMHGSMRWPRKGSQELPPRPVPIRHPVRRPGPTRAVRDVVAPIDRDGHRDVGKDRRRHRVLGHDHARMQELQGRRLTKLSAPLDADARGAPREDVVRPTC